MFLEERDGARPRELGGGLVIARCRVVVEAVLRARVEKGLVSHVVRLQRGLVGGPALVDALVVLGVVASNRSSTSCG